MKKKEKAQPYQKERLKIWKRKKNDFWKKNLKTDNTNNNLAQILKEEKKKQPKKS